MVAKNLNLYDVLVDLIPGTTAVIIIILPFTPEIGIAGSVGLLLLGYVAGRIFHALGSTGLLDSFRNWLEEHAFFYYTPDIKYGLSFRNRLRSVFSDDFDAFDGEIHDSEERVTRAVIRKLEREVGVFTEIGSGNIKSHSSIDKSVPDDVLYLKYFGENHLYGKNTLYRKYEILSTFYRSLWLAFLTLSITYVLFSVYILCSDGGLLLSPDNAAGIYLLLALFFLLISFLCLRQRLKFRFKKSRAFIIDLYQNL